MKLLDEIRAQPTSIRHLFMWTCVVIVFSFVGYWYLRETKSDIIALANPSASPVPGTPDDSTGSPFAAIGKSWKSLRASISELIQGDKKSASQSRAQDRPTQSPIPPQRLP